MFEKCESIWGAKPKENKMKKFKIYIKETQGRIVDIEAENEEKAIEKVADRYSNGGYILGADRGDLEETEIKLWK